MLNSDVCAIFLSQKCTWQIDRQNRGSRQHLNFEEDNPIRDGWWGHVVLLRFRGRYSAFRSSTFSKIPCGLARRTFRDEVVPLVGGRRIIIMMMTPAGRRIIFFSRPPLTVHDRLTTQFCNLTLSTRPHPVPSTSTVALSSTRVALL